MFRGKAREEYFKSLLEFLLEKSDLKTRFDYFDVNNLRLRPKHETSRVYRVCVYVGLALLYIYGLSWWE